MTQIALITGASRGLGAALALALAPTHHIVAVARTTGALEELDDSIRAAGGEATLAPMDITVDAAMQQLCRSIHDRWGSVALWIHTAIHPAPLSPVAYAAMKEMERATEVNLIATARLITYVSPLLGAEGRAVFFDDPKGGQPFFGAYGSTKAGQVALVRSWAAETEKTGPRVQVQEPRPMATGLRAKFHPGEDRTGLARPADEAARLLPAILG